MFIAAKFEEIAPGTVDEYDHITDRTYSKDEILSTECKMLTILGFQIAVPTAAHFVDCLLHANKCNEVHAEFIHYLLELALLDIRMMRYRPSHLVSAAVSLCNELYNKVTLWPAMCEQLALTERDLKAVSVNYAKIMKLLRLTASRQSIRVSESSTSSPLPK